MVKPGRDMTPDLVNYYVGDLSKKMDGGKQFVKDTLDQLVEEGLVRRLPIPAKFKVLCSDYNDGLYSYTGGK